MKIKANTAFFIIVLLFEVVPQPLCCAPLGSVPCALAAKGGCLVTQGFAQTIRMQEIFGLDEKNRKRLPSFP
jgi:hypothetical protein